MSIWHFLSFKKKKGLPSNPESWWLPVNSIPSVDLLLGSPSLHYTATFLRLWPSERPLKARQWSLLCGPECVVITSLNFLLLTCTVVTVTLIIKMLGKMDEVMQVASLAWHLAPEVLVVFLAQSSPKGHTVQVTTFAQGQTFSRWRWSDAV